MQTSVTALAAMAAAHTNQRVPKATATVNDPRIRGWYISQNSNTYSFPFDACIGAGIPYIGVGNVPTLIRAYNYSGSVKTGASTLHIATAVSGPAPTFSDVVSSGSLRWYSGVSVFTDPTDATFPDMVRVYSFDNSATPHIQYTVGGTGIGSAPYDSSDWNGPVNIVTMLDAQRTQSRPQIACAGWDGAAYTGTYEPYLFYTSTSSSDITRGTSLVFYDGVAGTNSRCGLTMDIPGYKQGYNSASGSNFVQPISGLAAFRLNATDFACILSVNSPRGLTQAGIYIIWYRDGIWSDLSPIYTYQPPLDGNSSYAISYPSIQLINGTYWVAATETINVPGLSTGQVQNTVSHLVTFRSNDTLNWHWTDGLIVAGTDSIGNGYWNSAQGDPTVAYNQSFVVSATQNDIANNKLLTDSSAALGSGSRVYMVGYGKLWQLNNGIGSFMSSSAAQYAANYLDVSLNVTDFTVSLPNGPSGTATVNLYNPTTAPDYFLYELGDQVYLEDETTNFILEDSDAVTNYNNSRILRHGSIITLNAGYTVAGVDYLVTIFTGRIDEMKQETELDLNGVYKNTITLSCKDFAIDSLDNWTTAQPLEYSSSIQVWVPAISDYGTTVQVQGNWVLQAHAGQMVGQQPNPSTSTSTVSPALDILTTNTDRVADGIYDMKFTFVNSIAGTTVTGGPIFRYNDNQNFYHIVYNQTGHKLWNLMSYDGSATGVSLLNISGGIVPPQPAQPVAGETWWIRTHIIQDQFIISARQDQTTTWNLIMSNSDLAAGKRIKTNSGSFGAATNSGQFIPFTIANTQATDSSYDITATPETEAIQFVVPSGSSVLNSYAVQLQVNGFPGGNIEFRILPDSGGHPDVWSNSIANTASVLSIPSIVSGGWTTININSSTAVTLAAGTYYIGMLVTNTVTDQNNFVSVPVSGTNGSGNMWSEFGVGTYSLVGGNALYSVVMSNTAGAFAVSAYALYSANEPHTLNDLTAEIAVKSGIMSLNPVYAINDTFASLANWDTAGERGAWTASGNQVTGNNAASTYGFLRYNSLTFGEMVMECDMTLGGGTSKGGFFIQQQNASPMSVDSNLYFYTIEFDASSNKCVIHACGTYGGGSLPTGSATGNIIFTSQPILNLSANLQYHVKIQHSGRFILVFLNSWLIAAVRQDIAYNTVGSTQTPIDETILRPHGYIGLLSYSNGGPAVTFANFKVAELKEIKDYFVIDQNTTGTQALQNLHKYDRVKYFGDYDASLRWGYFDNVAASGDTAYSNTIIKAGKTNSNRYWFAHISAFGDYNAPRYSGYLLDQEGSRFTQKDYTDARLDRSAYHAAAYPIRLARELTDGYEFTAAANPGIQREDRITITNALDGTNGEYLVDAVTFSYSVNPPRFDMTVTCRKFVSATAEGAA